MKNVLIYTKYTNISSPSSYQSIGYGYRGIGERLYNPEDYYSAVERGARD